MLFRISLFIWALLTANLVAGQHSKVDSLKALLPGTDRARALQAYCELAREYLTLDDGENALFYARRYSLNALSLRDTINYIRGQRLMAHAFRKLEFLDSATITAHNILPLAKMYSPGRELSQLMNGLSVGYMSSADYAEALKYGFLTYEEALKTRDTMMLHSALNNVGLIYYKLANYDKATEYYEAGMHLSDGDSLDLIRLMLNLGLCYSRKHKFEEARSMLVAAQKFCPKTAKRNYMELLYDWGVYYLEQRQYDSANVYLLECSEFAETQFNKQYQAICALDLATISFGVGQKVASRRYLTKAENILATTSFRSETLAVYLKLIELSKTVEADPKIIMEYQDKYVSLKDSIYSRNFLNGLISVERDFVERSKNVQLAEKERLVSEQQIRLERQKFVIFFVLVVVSLSVFVTVLLLRDYRRRAEINLILGQKVAERTRELEGNYLLMKHQNELQFTTLEKSKAQVRERMKAIEGLCNTGISDNSMSVLAKEYLRRILQVIS